MFLKRLMLAAVLLGMATGCHKENEKKPQHITERDAEPHDGGVGGDGWVLPLTPAWLRIKTTASAQFRPTAEAWVVEPAGGPQQLTVECREVSGGAETTLRQELEASQAKEKKDIAGVAAVTGPWLDGAMGRWTTASENHVLGRFQTLVNQCDVHAWSPKAGASISALEKSVGRFSSRHPAVVAELKRLSEFVVTHPQAQARAEKVGREVLGRALMQGALIRLPVERLARRFSLRLRMMEVLTMQECGALVRRQLDVSSKWLARMPEADAVEWIALTREAMDLGLRAEAPVRPPSSEELADVLAPMAMNDEHLQRAMMVLRHADKATDAELCDAERVRLNRVLSQKEPQRSVLMRSLLSDH